MAAEITAEQQALFEAVSDLKVATVKRLLAKKVGRHHDRANIKTAQEIESEAESQELTRPSPGSPRRTSSY